MRRISSFSLNEEEITSIIATSGRIAEHWSSVEDPGFLSRAFVCAADLPLRLRIFLEEFRLSEDTAACIISGFPVNDDQIGPSPVELQYRRIKMPYELGLEFIAALFSSLLGDVFGWRSQHSGVLVHDLSPVPENEEMQFGTGSRQYLKWHTEDAFDPCRAEFVAFFCLRNPDNVMSTIGTLDVSHLSDEQRALLSAPVFTFQPDASYLIGDEEPAAHAERGSILYGNLADPYLRLDPTYMEWSQDEQTNQAVRSAIELIDADLLSIALQPGDYLAINNKLTVHGRTGFSPRYDGTDRWTKRLNITRDLTKSRERRQTSRDRIILA
jgi:L-asparagine oxygenase